MRERYETETLEKERQSKGDRKRRKTNKRQKEWSVAICDH